MNKASTLLIYTPKLNARIEYIMRHCIEKMLGCSLEFTNSIETFIASTKIKISYSYKPLGNEFFIEKYGLLDEVGFNDIDISVSKWEDVPCFFRVSSESSIPFDIFSASFYLLSRYEEYQPYVKDMSGGFPAEESLAYKNDFLLMPLVDIWMHKFSYLLGTEFKKFTSCRTSFETNFIVTVHQAYAYKYKNFFRHWVGFVRDVMLLRFTKAISRCQVVFNFKKDPFDTYDYLLSWFNKQNYAHSWFFQLGDFTRSNRNISPHSTDYQKLIKHLADESAVGLLVSKQAIRNTSAIKTEIKRLEKITHQNLKSIFLADPSLGFPDIYLNAQRLGLEKDYSLGYIKSIGFRASTCKPFYFYDLNLEQTTPLQIQPYAIHFEAMKNIQDQLVIQEFLVVKNYTKKHGGRLNIILENSIFTEDFKQNFDVFSEALKY